MRFTIRIYNKDSAAVMIGEKSMDPKKMELNKWAKERERIIKMPHPFGARVEEKLAQHIQTLVGSDITAAQLAHEALLTLFTAGLFVITEESFEKLAKAMDDFEFTIWEYDTPPETEKEK